jgi:hypothetical protein
VAPGALRVMYEPPKEPAFGEIETNLGVIVKVACSTTALPFGRPTSKNNCMFVSD